MPVERRAAAGGATYSDSVSVAGPGRWVFVSGQLAVGPDGDLVEGGLAEQSDACFDLIERALAAHGGTLADVVRITVYLMSLEDFGGFAEVRGRRFRDALPASTAVQVAGLLRGALVEIDAISFLAD